MIPLFAWVDPTETTFVEASHAREDEDVFAFELSQSEGDFAQLSVTLRNPRVGLLRADRKQWAWFSARMPDDSVVPLFFGRLIGVPSNIFAELVTVDFVARPADFNARKAALAESLKELPYWDPIFIDEARRNDPDVVLEARTALWHIDPVTHAVTVSDVVTGEDGLVVVRADDHFYDDLVMALGQVPLRRVRIDARIPWTQSARGFVDFSSYLKNHWPNAGGRTGYISSYTYEGLISSWPKEGQNIGSGWFVWSGAATLINAPVVTDHAASVQGKPREEKVNWYILPSWVSEIEERVDSWSRNWQTVAWKAGLQFNRMVTQFQHEYALDDTGRLRSSSMSSVAKQTMVALGHITSELRIGYEVDRGQAERITLTLTADVQPMVTLPDEDEDLLIALNAIDVTAPLGEGVSAPLPDRRARSYITTTRGQDSLAYLVALARAHLVMRSRAVEVSFGTTFEKAVGITLRHNVTLHDPRIPGGEATGKVIGYTLSLDGESGALLAKVTLGCAIGRGGTVETTPGTPSYVNDGYVTGGYQPLKNRRLVPIAGVGFEVPLAKPNDDGINFAAGIAVEDALFALVIDNPAHQQEALLEAAGALPADMGFYNGLFDWPRKWNADALQEAQIERLKQVLADHKTVMRLRLKHLTGDFESPYDIAVTDLKIPRMIDLEAV